MLLGLDMAERNPGDNPSKTEMIELFARHLNSAYCDLDEDITLHISLIRMYLKELEQELEVKE